MTKESKVDDLGLSPNTAEDNLGKLQALLPEAFSEGRLDIEALKRTLGQEAVVESGERYRLDWAGKSDAYKVLQTPTTATLHPEREKSLNFDTAQHVFIEGENLEVLKVIQKAYFGKVKLIYIDPPYNTGNDSFIYPDRFQESKDEYLKRINQLDDDGTLMREGFFRKNSKENGHYHSNWLNMMLPRLYIARNLLREDGVIFISCDDNEVHNLRSLMNEIYGEENFIAQMIWEGASKNTADQIGVNHEYVLVYGRYLPSVPKAWKLAKIGVDPILRAAKSLRKKYGDDFSAASKELAAWFRANKSTPSFAHRRFRFIDKNGVYKEDDPTAPGGRKFVLRNPDTGKEIPLRQGRGWAFDQGEFERMVEQGRISFTTSHSIMVRRYLHETDAMTPQSVFYQPTRSASERLSKFLGVTYFDYPKDEEVIRQFVEMATDSSDDDCIVLDFFAGSATTAHAVVDQNLLDGGKRKSVMVQMPEPIDDAPSRQDGYETIADIGRNRATLRLQQSQSGERQGSHSGEVMGLRCFKLSPSCFRQWRGDSIESEDGLAEQIRLFEQSDKEGAGIESMLYELILRSGNLLTTNVETRQISSGRMFAIHDGKVIFLLEALSEGMLDELMGQQPEEIVVLDSAFSGSDELKTNLELQSRDAGIKFTCV